MKLVVSRSRICVKALILIIALSLAGVHSTGQSGSVGVWNSTQSYPFWIDAPAAFGLDGKIYVLGGYADAADVSAFLDNSVRFSVMNQNGTLQPWVSTSPFSTGRYFHAVALDPGNRRVYIVGGTDGDALANLNDVQFATIAPNGTIGSWQSTTPLPLATAGHKAFCHGGYLYVFRANNQMVGIGQGYYYAPILSDGRIGPWSLGTFYFPARRYYGAFAYNDHFYILGGDNGAARPFNQVKVSRVPQRSNLSYLNLNETEFWTDTAAFEGGRTFHSTAWDNGFVYIIGGVNAEFSSRPDRSDVQFARIQNDGQISSWSPTSSLPKARARHASVAHRGFLYVIGGSYAASNGDRQDTADIIYAPIVSPSDTLAPRTVITPAPGPQSAFPVEITLKATDIGPAGVSSIRWTTDGTDPNSSPSASSVIGGSAIFSISSEAKVRFLARDNAGNNETVQDAHYTLLQQNYVTGFSFPTDTRYPIDSLVLQTPEGYTYDQQFVSREAGTQQYYRVAQDFGENNPAIVPPPPYTESRHLGEDWNWGSDADDFGHKVHAIARGTVVFAGTASGLGRVIIIKHPLSPAFPELPAAGDGAKFVNSMYGHLGTDPNIARSLNIRMLRVGDSVGDREPIGYIGARAENGNYPPHLHLEIRLPNCPLLNTPGPGYFPRNSVLTPSGWIDPSAFIKANRASTPQLQMLASGGLTDPAQSSPSMSENGALVAFRNSPTYHLLDPISGMEHAVNVDAFGTKGNGELFTPSFSVDSTIKVYATDDGNVVPNDNNGVSDVFALNITTGVIERMSVSSFGEEGNGRSYDVAVSGDGNMVAFTSVASNLDPMDINGVSDIFLRNRTSGVTTLLSKVGAVAGNGPSHSPSFSSDGRYVVFVSAADNLVPNDLNGLSDIFLCDLSSGEISLISNGHNGGANGGSRQPSISGEGRFVTFESDASNIVPGDSNAVTDVFLFDRVTQTMQLLSVSSSGILSNGRSYSPRISSFGLRVAFVSEASNIVEDDLNQRPDVFIVSFESSPVLNAEFNGSNIILSWSVAYPGMILEWTETLPAVAWNRLLDVNISNDKFVLQEQPTEAKRFYRLRK